MGEFVEKIFRDRHIIKASVARDMGIKPQTLNDTFNRERIGDEVLISMSNAAGIDFLTLVKTEMAKRTGDAPLSVVSEPSALYGRSQDGLTLTVFLEEYDEAVQLQILRFLQQLPKK